MTKVCKTCGWYKKGFCTKKNKDVEKDYSCSKYRNKKEDMATLSKAFQQLIPKKDETTNWLLTYRPSLAFITAVNAGPWKLARRAKVQYEARIYLGDRDLNILTLKDLKKICPLQWQIDSIMIVNKNLKGKKFDDYILQLMEIAKTKPIKARKKFLALVNNNLTKVISLFMRDYMNLECFPIDRHVKQWLIYHNLPVDENYITRIGRKTGLLVREYARAIFLEKAQNPEPTI